MGKNVWSGCPGRAAALTVGSVPPVGGTKVFVMPGGMMKSNANLVDLIEKVKPEIRTLIEKCNTVSRGYGGRRRKAPPPRSLQPMASTPPPFLAIARRSRCGSSCSSPG